MKRSLPPTLSGSDRRKLVLAAVGLLVIAGVVWQCQSNVRLRRESAPVGNQHDQLATPAGNTARPANDRAAEATAPLALPAPIEPGVPEKPSDGGAVPAEVPPIKVDRSDPRAVAESVRLAIAGGEPEALLNAIVIDPDGLDLAERGFERLPPELRERYGTAERMVAELLCASSFHPKIDARSPDDIRLIPGGASLSPALADDPNYATLHARARDEAGRLVEIRMTYQKTDDGWRWVVSSADVLRRLAEIGLTPSRPAPAPGPTGD